MMALSVSHFTRLHIFEIQGENKVHEGHLERSSQRADTIKLRLVANGEVTPLDGEMSSDVLLSPKKC